MCISSSTYGLSNSCQNFGDPPNENMLAEYVIPEFKLKKKLVASSLCAPLFWVTFSNYKWQHSITEKANTLFSIKSYCNRATSIQRNWCNSSKEKCSTFLFFCNSHFSSQLHFQKVSDLIKSHSHKYRKSWCWLKLKQIINVKPEIHVCKYPKWCLRYKMCS